MSPVAVILADGSYSVRHRTHPATRNADGLPVLATPAGPVGPWPGAAHEIPGFANNWSFRLDPRVWPLREGDLIIGGGRTWTVETRPALFINQAAPDVDYVSCNGTLTPEEIV